MAKFIHEINQYGRPKMEFVSQMREAILRKGPAKKAKKPVSNTSP